MTNDNKGKIALDPVLDAPGDLVYPFAALRLYQIPEQLRVTRSVQDKVATAMEDARLHGDVYATSLIGVCIWAIQELEAELIALKLRELRRGEKSNG